MSRHRVQLPRGKLISTPNRRHFSRTHIPAIRSSPTFAKMFLLPFASILPLMAAAASIERSCKIYKTDYTAKVCGFIQSMFIVTEEWWNQFDDLTFNDGGFSPIPPHYYGLSYFTFQVDQFDGFIQAASGNQWAMSYGGSGTISIPDS
jgi:hypothetical protein